MHYNHLEDVPGIERIVAERYVWHVAPIEKRKFIFQNGLVPELSEHNCIFANNQSTNIFFFYPFCLEEYEGTLRDEHFLLYDYWRIDTHSFQADWYIDPNMKNGPIEYMGDKKYFVVTESPIPCEAIELFEVGEEFISKKMYIILSGLEKSTGWNHDISLLGKQNLDIKKEISEYRKTHSAIKTKTIRYRIIDYYSFPLVKSI
jgi:hypothetical protein